jgi:L,D-transpeptidase YcbB
MKGGSGTVLLSLAILLLGHNPGAAQERSSQALSDLVREVLRNRIETSGQPPVVIVGKELIYSSEVLPLFYQNRFFRPAWSGEGGPLDRVRELIEALRVAGEEGLSPEDYHLSRIEGILGNLSRPQRGGQRYKAEVLADLDLMLTDAFLVYASHLLFGRVNPETIDPEWAIRGRGGDVIEVLQAALASDRIHEALQDLLPRHADYGRMRERLAEYRALADQGGWITLTDGPLMKDGSRGARVAELQRFLSGSGDLAGALSEDSESYDPALLEAVRRFQRRHGLDDDGVVGPMTLAEMKVPVEKRIREIELNMERWRWLPQDLGDRYLLVNIANFELTVVEQGQTVMSMRAIVGKPYRRTPVFTGKMTYLVLNPYWEVPLTIASQDILPAVRDDPDYLFQKKIRVLQGFGAVERELDPGSIDWAAVRGKNLRFRFRQDPGPENALGRIKFMFPNKFDVYLHDTPARELFAKTERVFSSGCVRIENPLALAEYLLANGTGWTKERLLAAIEEGAERTVRLPSAIPVHLLYWTAWIRSDGSLQFRRDVYGRDEILARALEERPPSVNGSG